MQDILHLFIQNGVAFDQRNLGKFLRDMEVGGVERLISQFSVDDAQVNYEHSRLGMGQWVDINPFDNDITHVAGHEDFQKSARYRSLPPEIQQMVQQHVDMHKQRIQEKQVQEQQQMIAQQQMQQGAEQQAAPQQAPPGA
jgi:protein associated with RNAse G/E